MIKRALTLAVAGCLLVPLLIAAGCGGDSESSLTKAEFVRQGEAACKKLHGEREEAIRAYLTKLSQESQGALNKASQLGIVKAAALPPIKTEIVKLQELGAPEGEEDKVDAIVEGLEDAVVKTEENPAIVLSAKSSPFEEVGELAKEFGFETCGQFG